MDASQEQLTVYFRENNANTAVLAQLEPVFAAKRRVQALDAQIGAKRETLNQLVTDQKRLRDNLSALKGSSGERALARRYTAELDSQEDTLAALRHDLTTLQEQRVAADAELGRTIESLHVDATS